VLLAAKWDQNIQGEPRARGPRIGTCTVAEPATNNDNHWISKKLANLASPTEVELHCDPSPRRPVWATLDLQTRYKAPVQVTLKLAKEKRIGLTREPDKYEGIKRKINIGQRLGDDTKVQNVTNKQLLQ